MKKKLSLLLVALFLLTVTGLNARADETFRVAKALNFISTNLRAVQDPDTGNILVIINELKANDASYGRVDTVLVKRREDGSYSPGKLRILTPAGEWHGRPSGIYLQPSKLFLVVWDTADPTKFGGPSRILGQYIKATNGKPKGGNFDLINDGANNVAPVISHVLPAATGSRVSFPNVNENNVLFTLVWTRYKPFGTSPADGLDGYGTSLTFGYSDKLPKVRLDVKNILTLKPLQQDGGYQLGTIYEHGNSRIYLRSDPLSLTITLKGYTQLREGSSFTTRGVYDNYLYDFKRKTVTFDWGYELPRDTYTPSGIRTSGTNDTSMNKLIIADHVQLHIRAFYYEGETLKQEKPLTVKGSQAISAYSVNGRNTFLWTRQRFAPPNVAPPAKPVRGRLIIAADNGLVYQQRITDGGQNLKKPKKIFRHGNRLESMIAYRINLPDDPAGQSDVLILWQRRVTANKHEALAYFTKLK